MHVARNLQTKATYPDHVLGTNPGDADYGITEVRYDGLRRLRVYTDQQGDYVTPVYDLASRMTERQYRDRTKLPTDPANDTDTFTYDAASRILTATKGRYSNTVTLSYDDASRVLSESLSAFGQTYAVGYAYDLDNRVTGLTYPDGSTVSHAFTDRDQLQQVDYNSNLVASFTYDDGRRETSRSFGNGLVTSRTYRNDNLTASISTPGVTSFSYSYDANKNKTAETIGGVMSNYGFTTGAGGYDDEDRLIAWNRDDGNRNQAWNLLLVGDWDTFTENGTPEVRIHNDVHEILTKAGSPLTHDPKGNLTTNSNGQTYTWDFDNQLSSATASGLNTYTYDALGRRVSKTVAGSTTVFVCSGMRVIAEYSGGATAANPDQKYVYGSYIDEPLLLDQSGTEYYYHCNHLFSVAALTDISGTIVERYGYDAYGKVTILDSTASTILTASSISNPYLFTGRRLDQETGLYYFRARYYDVELGRFIGRDPIGYDGGINLYAYAAHAPTWLLDPFGLDPIEAIILPPTVVFAEGDPIPSTPGQLTTGQVFWLGTVEVGRGLLKGTVGLGAGVVDEVISTLTFTYYDNCGCSEEWANPSARFIGRLIAGGWIGYFAGGANFAIKVPKTANIIQKTIVLWNKYGDQIILVVDAAHNAISVVRGAQGMLKDDLTWGNAAQFFGGMAGFGGQLLGRWGKQVPESCPAPNNPAHRILPDGQVDPAATLLGNKFGGQASVRIEGFGNREFDFVSGRYVGQTFSGNALSQKPKNFLSKSRRNQIRQTMEAAKATGRQPLFNFEGVTPHQDVLDFISRNADRIGVTPRITNIVPSP